MVRYKKRSGFENRLRAVARHSRISKIIRNFSAHIFWEGGEQGPQGVRKFRLIVGETYDKRPRFEVLGTIERVTGTKWGARITTVGIVDDDFRSYSSPQVLPRLSKTETVNVRCDTVDELVAFVQKRDEEVAFECKLLELGKHEID